MTVLKSKLVKGKKVSLEKVTLKNPQKESFTGYVVMQNGNYVGGRLYHRKTDALETYNGFVKPRRKK